MTSRSEISSRLATMSQDDLLVFSAACAERVYPFGRALGTRDYRVVYRSVLDSLWRISARGAKPQEGSELDGAVAAIVMEGVEDSHTPDYWAMRVLNILSCAVLVVHDEKPTDCAVAAANGTSEAAMWTTTPRSSCT